jgi:hypothetical protein
MDIQRQTMAWADFKAALDKKNPNPQMTETAADYCVWFDEGFSCYYCAITKGSEDAADFEATWKAACNWAVGVRQYPWATSDFDFAADGFTATLTEWTDNHADGWFKIEEDGLYMNGGEMFVFDGFVKGDWAEMAIADKDGVAYPAGTVIKEWIKRRYLSPDGACECNTPYAGKPPKNFYVRVRYHRVDSNNRTIAVNLNLHRAI